MNNLFLRLIWNSYTRDFVLYLLRFFPIKRKRTFYICWGGSKYGCNPKAIAETLHNTDSSYEIGFAFISPEQFVNEIPMDYKVLELGSLYYFYYLATSKIIVSNTRFTRLFFPYKKKSQKYIFTGHGSFGIKKIEFDAEESLSPEYLALAVEDTRRTDLMLSNAVFRTKVFRSGYRYTGEVLEQGIPRNDVLFSTPKEKVVIAKESFVKECLPSYKGKLQDLKFLIYAPTFRKDGDFSNYRFDVERVINCLSKQFGGNWYVLISSHPNMLNVYKNIYDFSNERLIDIAKKDLHPFLLFSDVLITDYSSVEMDFSLLNKPVFQLCRDVRKYDRGFYINPRELPFPFAENDDELCENILNFDFDKYLFDLNKFNIEVGIKDSGKASESVVKWIIKQNE